MLQYYKPFRKWYSLPKKFKNRIPTHAKILRTFLERVYFTYQLQTESTPTHATKLQAFLRRCVSLQFNIHPTKPMLKCYESFWKGYSLPTNHNKNPHPPMLQKYKHFWRGVLASSVNLTQTKPNYNTTNLFWKGIVHLPTWNRIHTHPCYKVTSIFKGVCWLQEQLWPKPTHTTILWYFLERVYFT